MQTGSTVSINPITPKAMSDRVIESALNLNNVTAITATESYIRYYTN